MEYRGPDYLERLMSRIINRHAFLAVWLFGGISCGGAQKVEEQRASLSDSVMDREEAMVIAAKEFSDEAYFEARYNPVPCPCPPFELRTGERWIRVVLVYSEEEGGQIQALIRDAKKATNRGENPTYYLQGSLDPDRIQRTVIGFPVMEFDFVSYSLDPPNESPDEPTN